MVEIAEPGGHGGGAVAVLECLKGHQLTDAGTAEAVLVLLLCLQPTKPLIYIKDAKTGGFHTQLDEGPETP